MVRCSHHSLFLYKTLSKSTIIKTFEMDRRKLQRRLRILILLQQMRRIKQPNHKKRNIVGSETFFKIENVKVLSKHYFMKCVMTGNCFFVISV